VFDIARIAQTSNVVSVRDAIKAHSRFWVKPRGAVADLGPSRPATTELDSKPPGCTRVIC